MRQNVLNIVMCWCTQQTNMDIYQTSSRTDAQNES